MASLHSCTAAVAGIAVVAVARWRASCRACEPKSGGFRSKNPNAEIKCELCDIIMRNDADLRKHLRGKKHAVRVAQSAPRAANHYSGDVAIPTHSCDFFSSTVGVGACTGQGIRVITCDLEHPQNAVSFVAYWCFDEPSL
jgi:hypothetical protein